MSATPEYDYTLTIGTIALAEGQEIDLDAAIDDLLIDDLVIDPVLCECGNVARPDDWMCTPCLVELLTQGLPAWGEEN